MALTLTRKQDPAKSTGSPTAVRVPAIIKFDPFEAMWAARAERRRVQAERAAAKAAARAAAKAEVSR